MPRTKKTADVKATETTTTEVKEVVKAAPIEEANASAKAEPKKAGKKPTAKKAAAPAKAKEETKTGVAPVEEVKAESKEAPKKAGRKPAAKKAASAKTEKKAPTKAAKPVTTSVLQVAGNEFDFDKVVKAVEGLKKKNEGKSLEIYIKPEDNAIYYVVNGKGGKKIDL